MNIEVDPNWWKSLFDDLYLLTDARTVCDQDVTRREVDIICHITAIAQTDRVLDLCGGQGRHSIELASRGFTGCTVLDYSEILLERGRANAAQRRCQVEFVQGNATEIKLPSASFDHVLVLGNSLGYLPDSVDDLRIMREAYRVLSPGGNLLIDVTDGAIIRKKFRPNAWHEIEANIVVCRQRELADNCIHAREIVLCKKQGLLRDQTYSIRTYDPESLQDLVAQAGFEDIRIKKGFTSYSEKEDYGFMNHRLLLTAGKPENFF